MGPRITYPDNEIQGRKEEIICIMYHIFAYFVIDLYICFISRHNSLILKNWNGVKEKMFAQFDEFFSGLSNRSIEYPQLRL